MSNLFLIIFCFILSFRKPIVAVTNGQDIFFLATNKRGNSAIQKGTIKRHIERFIKNRYEWEEFKPDIIVKGVTPSITKGFKLKLMQELKGIKSQLEGKELSQTLAGLKIVITDKSTVAIFDRVLRINNVPLLIPTELSFILMKGDQNKSNPSGLEINGVLIHEER